MDTGVSISPTRKFVVDLPGIFSFLFLLFLTLVSPHEAVAVPSYARQTGLACSGCHYNPPELNPAGRRFKLLAYVDRADDTKVVKAEGGKSRAALDLLASLPLSVMFETSFTNTKSPVPTTQNGNLQVPQDMSLFLSGAWTSHVGSFLQVTYETQSDHFTSDNTDIRYANKALTSTTIQPSRISGTLRQHGGTPGSPAMLPLPRTPALSLMVCWHRTSQDSAAMLCGTIIFI